MRLFPLYTAAVLWAGAAPAAAVDAEVITPFFTHYESLSAIAAGQYDGGTLRSEQGTGDLTATFVEAHVGASMPGTGYVGTIATKQNHGTINSSLSLAGTNFYYAYTNGLVSYNFKLQPKDQASSLDLSVPVRVEAHGTVRADGASAQAYFGLYTFNNTNIVLGRAENFREPGAKTDAFDIDRVFNLLPGIYSVALGTRLEVSSYEHSGSAEAFIDPSFTIDPGFALNYEIVGIPGTAVAAVGAVPEPATWAMMVIGMGGARPRDAQQAQRCAARLRLVTHADMTVVTLITRPRTFDRLVAITTAGSPTASWPIRLHCVSSGRTTLLQHCRSAARLGDRLVRNRARHGGRRPAAAERAVERDEVERELALDLHLLRLRLKRRRLRAERRVEVRDAADILRAVEHDGTLRVAKAGSQCDQLTLVGGIARQRVGGLGQRGQHRLAVGDPGLDRSLLALALLRAQSPGVEQRRHQLRGERIVPAAAVEQRAELRRDQPERAGQGDRRIERRGRAADVVDRGRQLALRLANVGPPLEQVGRQPDRHFGRRCGKRAERVGSGRKLGRQRIRQLPEQQPELMHARLDCAFERRDLRLCRREFAPLLDGVDLVRQAAAAARRDQPQQVGLARGIRLDDCQPRLVGAQLQIGARDFGGDGDIGVARAPHLRLGAFGRGTRGALVAAEQVEIPGRVEADLIGVEFETGKAGPARSPPPPPDPPPAPPPNNLVMLDSPALSLIRVWVTEPLPFSCGNRSARATRAAWRASRTRDAAVCRSRLPASARSIRLSSSASPNPRHHAARSALRETGRLSGARAPDGSAPVRLAGTSGGGAMACGPTMQPPSSSVASTAPGSRWRAVMPAPHRDRPAS